MYHLVANITEGTRSPGENRIRGATWASARISRAASMTSPSTAVAVGCPAGTRSRKSNSSMDGPSMKIAFVAPRIDASG